MSGSGATTPSLRFEAGGAELAHTKGPAAFPNTKETLDFQGFQTHQGPSFEGPWLVAGAGFEPATFGL